MKKERKKQKQRKKIRNKYRKKETMINKRKGKKQKNIRN